MVERTEPFSIAVRRSVLSTQDQEMTTKRSRFDRKKKLLVAPGREPDEIDEMLAAMRDNLANWPAPAIKCRVCKRDLPITSYKFGERSKATPICLACAAAWRPKASVAVRAIVSAEKPKPPLAALVAYRRDGVIAEDAAAEDAYFTEMYRQAEEWGAEQEAQWQKWIIDNT